MILSQKNIIFARKMKPMIYQYLITLFFLLMSTATYSQNISLQESLLELDKAVANHKSYITKRQNEIVNYKNEFDTRLNIQDKYVYYKYLSDMYLRLDIDSAIYYGKKKLELSQRNGMKLNETASWIDLAFIYVLNMDLLTADNILKNYNDISLVDTSCQAKLAMTELQFHMRGNLKLNQKRTPEFNRLMAFYWNKYKNYLPHNSWIYYFYEGMITNKPNPEALKRCIDESPNPSIQRAMLYSVYSRCFDDKKQQDKVMLYTVLSAINDIQSANREANSLLTLLRMPGIEKSSKRAMEYAALCAENAQYYQDRYRSLDVVYAHSIITEQYQKKLEASQQKLMFFLIILSMLVIAIVILLYAVRKRGKKNEKMLNRIREINSELQQSVSKEKLLEKNLIVKNSQLAHEIELRNASFIDIYKLVSQYFKDTEDFHKNIYNMITAGKVERARHMLSSTDAFEKSLRDFYHQFDVAFINTHPDFIDNLNAILKPEHRVTISDDLDLSPSLRICALISIGITNSISIATFLHYSPQTVYNYRLRLRRNAGIPEKEFTKRVASMYMNVTSEKYQDTSL